MKKIVCELCDSTEFAKDGDLFVCQGCGTKYTTEQAKGMMREVEGGAPAANSAPVSNPNQQQLDNILILASNAYDADNKKEAESYCNRAIELDATCYKAWFLKGKAVGWQSTIDNLRIEEAAHSFVHAIEFAPEEEKAELRKQAVEELKNLGIALVSLRKNRFSGSPDDKELKGFSSDATTILDALKILLRGGAVIDDLDAYMGRITTLMNEAGVAALNMARKAWNKVEHPNNKDLTTFIDWCSNIESLFRQAINLDDKNDEANIVRWRNVAVALEEPIGKNSKKQYWDSFWSEYRWTNDQCLTDAAVKSREASARQARSKATALENKIKAEKAVKEAAERKAREEKRKAFIENYWNNHPEEKEKLEAEKKQLEAKKKELEPKIAELDKQIREIQAAGKDKVPSDIEADKLREQVKDLTNQRSGLGFFAFKEKKRLTEEIEALDGKVAELRRKAAEEKKSRDDLIRAKAAPFVKERDGLTKEKETAQKRISAIQAELATAPGAPKV